MVTCDVCDQPILRLNNGALEVSSVDALAEAHRREQYHAVTTNQPVDALDIPVPQTTRWRFTHKSCRSEGHTYWIGLDQIDTPQKALGWTAHLFRHRWAKHTDWFDALTRLGFVDRSTS